MGGQAIDKLLSQSVICLLLVLNVDHIPCRESQIWALLNAAQKVKGSSSGRDM
jgi:hypothetical protein